MASSTIRITGPEPCVRELDFFDFYDLLATVIPAARAHAVRLLGIAALGAAIYGRLLSDLRATTLATTLLRNFSLRNRHLCPCLVLTTWPSDNRHARARSCMCPRSGSCRSSGTALCTRPGTARTPVPPAPGVHAGHASG